MLVCQWCVGITQEAWEWALVNKYGKVCYTNLLTQAQVPYTNFDFPKLVVSTYDTRASWSAPESKNQKLLGFGICSSAIF